MKRFLALAIAVPLGLTIAPMGATATASTEPVALVTQAAVKSPASAPVDRDNKARKCRTYCVQSTLPKAEVATFFVNGNRHLISVNNASITLRNLDTRKIVDTERVPVGFSFFRSAASPDGEEIYVLASDFETPVRVYRLDTVSLALEDVSPVSPSYPVGVYKFAVIPDRSGYVATSVNTNGEKFLCRYSDTGAEMGCSERFSGSGQRESDIHFDYSSQFAFLMGAENKLFTFTLADMSFTQDILTGFNPDFDHSHSHDGLSMFVGHDATSVGNLVTQVSHVSRVTQNLVESLDLPGRVLIEDVLSTPYELYVLGQTFKTNGSAQKYSTLFVIDTYEGFEVSRTIKIPNSRSNRVSRLLIDSERRYLLATGDNVATSVIPVSGADIFNRASYRSCPTRWSITWDFLNLQPGGTVKYYDIFVRNDVDGAPWVRKASVRSGGEHLYELTDATPGQIMQVLPRKVKYGSHQPLTLDTEPSTIRLSGAGQPRC